MLIFYYSNLSRLWSSTQLGKSRLLPEICHFRDIGLLGSFQGMKKLNQYIEDLVRWANEVGASDIRVKNFSTAFAYGENFEQERKEIYFKDQKSFLEALKYYCFENKVRLDQFQPIASGRFYAGRFTILLSSVTGNYDELYLRMETALPSASNANFCDPKNLLEIFDENFYRFHWIICGASGVGKSTFLKKTLNEKFPNERIAVLDKYDELRLESPHAMYLRETAPSLEGFGGVDIHELLHLSLRLSTTNFVLGEMRLDSFEVFAHGALSGHGNAFTTFHATDYSSLSKRLSLQNPLVFESIKEQLGAVFIKKINGVREIVSVDIPKKNAS